MSPIEVHVIRGGLVRYQQSSPLRYPIARKLMCGVLVRVGPVPGVAPHDQSTPIHEELDDFLVITLVITIPELCHKAVQPDQVVRVGTRGFMAL